MLGVDLLVRSDLDLAGQLGVLEPGDDAIVDADQPAARRRSMLDHLVSGGSVALRG